MNIDKKDVTDTNKQPDGDANSILLCSPHDIQKVMICLVSLSLKSWLQIHNLLQK
jgi:hypothetical protein